MELILEAISAAVEYLVWIFTGKKRSEDTPSELLPMMVTIATNQGEPGAIDEGTVPFLRPPDKAR